MIVEVLDVLSQKGTDEDSLVEGDGARQGEGAVAALSDLSERDGCRLPYRLARNDGGARGDCHALPELRKPRHAGEGLAADGGFRRRSAAAACA